MQVLTPIEEQLIKKASEVQLQNLLDLHSEGHEEFNEYLEEYPEDDYMTISSEITNKVIDFENLQQEPYKIWSMDKHSLLVMQFIVLKMIPNEGSVSNRKKLYFKLQKTIQEINGITLN